MASARASEEALRAFYTPLPESPVPRKMDGRRARYRPDIKTVTLCRSIARVAHLAAGLRFSDYR